MKGFFILKMILGGCISIFSGGSDCANPLPWLFIAILVVGRLTNGHGFGIISAKIQAMVKNIKLLSFTEFTLTGQFHLGKLTFMPELRFDSSDQSAFLKHDGTTTGSTFTGLLAATYTF